MYISKADGSTTEIDLIMISETGIYVFESKNYSGWIFGDEKNRNWTQSLPNRQKNKFLNPIWQNKGHINALENVLNKENPDLYKSYIIFSKRCTLKKVTVRSPHVKVINRDRLPAVIKQDIKGSLPLLTKEEIDQTYTLLQKYSHADELVKQAHIHQINAKKV